ncbi:DUF3703 domain-containing protein [Adhaeribacter swui]|uniref:DUF3703 domain-containing protein n=1 Tax=Adhaeribacter swui TaxID=2086471 RepID=A0A7G7GCF9_9BACT|nr:DUF3703 domain-containing protein [Adhaeribacter swui]QNF34843.1 DUF3703 domain-containing protein [Adhaeribacter swui]
MWFNWKMPRTLRPYYEQELKEYQQNEQKQQLVKAWYHLERAHILGQPYPVEHTVVHGKMLAFGIKSRNTKEVVGQLPRLLVGGIKSWAGTIPVGNTGGANVAAWKPMPIPDDLQEIIRQANSKVRSIQ